MRSWAPWLAALSCSVGLAACVSPVAPPQPAAPAELPLLDARFAPPAQPVDVEAALRASPAMLHFLQHDIATQLRREGLRLGLVHALQQPGALRLHYDAALTRNAAQAFEARAGNCLSLVLMTASLARELGLEVRYQAVEADAQWSRSAGLLVASTHVNITLGRRFLGEPAGYDQARELTVDFLPPEDVRGQRVQTLAERSVVAMYLNNRAAEALASGDLDQAYAWSRAAVLKDPAFLGAQNTLAVVYLRHGDAEAAQRVLAQVLAREPGHTTALANQVQALQALGRHDEAQALAAELARREPQTPFRHYQLGMAALRAGDAGAAKVLFLKELARDPDYHEFHFALAQAEWQLGHPEEARRQLAAAQHGSPPPATGALYAAKLDWLRAQQDKALR